MTLFKLENYDIDISRLNLSIDQKDAKKIVINIYLKHHEQICPKCNSTNCVIHDYVLKKILHPVRIGNEAIEIHLHLKRYKCKNKNCNRVWIEKNPISNSKVSFKGIEFLINQLKSYKKTFSQLSKECFISKSYLIKIFNSCVNVNEVILPNIISFDEVCVGSFSSECKYVFVMFDFVHNTIVDIYKTRLKNILNQNFLKIPLSQREKVEYITMDGWDPYRYLVRKFFPKAKIALDSFHVLEAIGRALDKIRLIIAKRFKSLGTYDGHKLYRLFKDNKKLFYCDWSNQPWPKYLIKKTECKSFSHFIGLIRKASPDFSEAYALKEEYRLFNKKCSINDAKEKLIELLSKFKKSKFNAYHEVATMIENWFEEILNSFIVINGKRLSTGAIERHNQHINLLNANGSGYSNFEHFRKRVMLFYGKCSIDLFKLKRK